MVQIRRLDIHFSVTPLNRFLAAPREVHIKRLVNIPGYFQDATRRQNIVFISLEDVRKSVARVLILKI